MMPVPIKKNILYEAVIGLEVHVQLNTKSKLFCGCSANFGALPNSQTCPVCLGLPGALPVINQKAIDLTLIMGLATECRINRTSRMARKNYFYPDLPKGYQITQFEEPLCERGTLLLDPAENSEQIRIKRIHLEEDAGKSIHHEGFVEKDASLIDLNRCGIPLMEVVTEPDFRSTEQVGLFLKKLRQLSRYLSISDANMEEGSLRCDANISLRLVGQSDYGTRTELKNMNSIRNVRKALEYEIDRQTMLLKQSGQVIQQTLLWDDNAGIARPTRQKEDSDDYRYFPEPDLPPIKINLTKLALLKNSIPELPYEKQKRFSGLYGLNTYDTALLTESREIADYFETTLNFFSDPKLTANWIIGELSRILREEKISLPDFSITPERFAGLLHLIKNSDVSRSAAKTILNHMINTGDTALQLKKKRNLGQVSDEKEIKKTIVEFMSENPDQLAAYKDGNTKLFDFFVGQIMKQFSGKANPDIINRQLREILGSEE